MGGLLPLATDTEKGLYPAGYINTIKRTGVASAGEYLLGRFNTPAGSAVYLALKYIAGNSGDCFIATVTMGRSGTSTPRFGYTSTKNQEFSRFLELKYKTNGEEIIFYLKTKLNGTIYDEIPYSISASNNSMKNINLQTTTIPEDAINVEFS